ncbi:MAG: translation initiation factor IF-2 N-terminal domain-containing protein, partial [Sciscionella sp.]
MSNPDQPAENLGGDTGEPNRPELVGLPAKLRVHALAKLLGTSSKEVIAAITALGQTVKSAQSSVDRDTAIRVGEAVLGDGAAAATGRGTAGQVTEQSESAGAAAGTEDAAPGARARGGRKAPVAPVFAPPVFLQPETAAPAADGDDPAGDAKAGQQAPRKRTRKSAGQGGADAAGGKSSNRGEDSGSNGKNAGSGASAPADADDEDSEDAANRRRRRRGRRGRGRGKGGNGEDTTESSENTGKQDAGKGEGNADKSDTPGDGKPGGSRSGARKAKSDEGDAKGADADDQPAGSGADAGDADKGEDDDSAASRRRRRRRRRTGSDGEGSGAEGDPPNTVTHVRETRQGRADSSSSDEVRSVRGSTRLEAKRQRRRDGREAGRRRVPILSEAEFLARRESVDRSMVVRQRGDRTQIGVLEDGVLVEHYVTTAKSSSYAGNVYLGRVQNVLPSMEAAFIDIGRGRNAVLYAGEVNFAGVDLGGQPKRIEAALKSGQSVVVQVTKGPVGQKGARLTAQIGLPGRYLVYSPDSGTAGISRKLPDKERERLKQVLKQTLPENGGVIVRTAAEGA